MKHFKKGDKVTLLDGGITIKGTVSEVKRDLIHINIPSFLHGIPMQVVRTHENLLKLNKK